jgi:UV excision repair protein RAD23
LQGIPAGLESVAQPAAAPQAAPPTAPAPAPAPTPAAPAANPVATPTQPAPAAPRIAQNQNLFQLAQQQQAQPQPAAGGRGGQGIPPLMIPVGPGGGLDMEAIANQPQIQHLRQLLQQNPQMIQPILQDIATQNPQLAQMFASNPQFIAQLLDINLDDVGDDANAMEGQEQSTAITVTAEEAAAIQRVSVHYILQIFLC